MISLQEGVEHLGFRNNLLLQNGEVELILATEFGPRVMSYRRAGGRNVFAQVPPSEQRKSTPYGDDWHIYGGHRLWFAPETDPGSYEPDNAPVQWARISRGVRLSAAPSVNTGLAKELEVTIEDEGTHVRVEHRLLHRGKAPLELAPWALSVMAPGGRAFFPLGSYRAHPEALTPRAPLVYWPFTRMNDARWTWGDRFFFLRHDRNGREPQKIGYYSEEGYLGYELDGELFLKRHAPQRGAHADFGCNVETFTNELFLEVETLGPLVTLEPGQSVEHIEHWFLFEGFRMPESEPQLASALEPLLRRSSSFVR